MLNKQLAADAALLLVTFIWGTTFLVVKRALGGIGPYYFVALRFLLAFIFLALMAWRQLPSLDRLTALHGGVVGLFLSAGCIFQTLGLQYTSAANAGFISGLSVILVPILEAFFARTLPGIFPLLGALSATTGLALLTLKGRLALNPGDFLVFLCALSFAGQIILVERYTSDHDSLLFTTVQLGTVTLVSFLLAIPLETLPVTLTPAVWQAFLLTALPATSLAYLIQNKVQQFTTATHTAIIFTMEPVFAALVAYFWGQEALTWQQGIGCFLILVGMFLAELKVGTGSPANRTLDK
ncbi:EamA-like transporter family protein [Moorella thermoacetica]|uniref:EamA-like transporter family protein n=2 Tax=Neomoorella thermoacetica TaxID=1525 RepID=A0AAC9MUQ2_NEOTH|nr:EamA-like transporter family protein [Moorella thermoacetica]GAF26872.1 permeases of the drug/metabolite transporter (DMT) superfamily [Moorella thermoacetica Y72]AOQ23807.1 EamA-like transporter family protein [Moorella thermoacetica]APC08265.1 EamA-like transporter family protein [Moorella thermoacetica]OIQ56259.1 EamA-like transporter family protein [Moorella thermoacetica]